jgi:hypothetical protein
MLWLAPVQKRRRYFATRAPQFRWVWMCLPERMEASSARPYRSEVQVIPASKDIMSEQPEFGTLNRR